jgi:hypothetical protein
MRTELADISLENIRDVWGGSASNKIKNSIAIIV